MASETKLRIYQYINRPYDRVRAALHDHSQMLFQSATRAATSRADALAATLRLNAGGLEVGVDVRLQIRDVTDEQSVPLNSQVTRVRLGWEAIRATALFPAMEATLSVWPLSSAETQIEIDGAYRPPLGVVGQAIDGVVGHRIAEASMHRFLEDFVEQLRRDLPA